MTRTIEVLDDAVTGGWVRRIVLGRPGPGLAVVRDPSPGRPEFALVWVIEQVAIARSTTVPMAMRIGQWLSDAFPWTMRRGRMNRFYALSDEDLYVLRMLAVCMAEKPSLTMRTVFGWMVGQTDDTDDRDRD